MAGLCKPVAAGLTVALRVTPNAGRDRIEGVACDADGHPFLKIAVTAVPENGKANDAVVKLIAKHLKLPKTSLSIVSGMTARRKVLLIAGDAHALEQKLAGTFDEWLKLRDAA